MFLNCLNSYDFSLLLSFITRYSIPKVKLSRFFRDPFQYDYKNSSFNNCKTNNINFQLVGKELITCYFASVNKLSPDKTFRISSHNIYRSSDSDISKIHCSLNIRGTKLYDISKSQLFGDLADKFGRIFNTKIEAKDFASQFADNQSNCMNLNFDLIKLNVIHAEDEVTYRTKNTLPFLFNENINLFNQVSNQQTKSIEVPSSLFTSSHINRLIEHFDPNKPYLNSNNNIQKYLATPGKICVDTNLILNVNSDKRIVNIEFR